MSQMTHEYIPGYWLKLLQGELDAMVNQFENENDERQQTLDNITMGTDAYLTSKEIMQNYRENFLRERQRDLDIPTLAENDPDSGFGTMWDYDSPEGKFGNFWQKSMERIFGWKPNIHLIEGGDNTTNDYKSIDDIEGLSGDDNDIGANLGKDNEVINPDESLDYVDRGIDYGDGVSEDPPLDDVTAIESGFSGADENKEESIKSDILAETGGIQLASPLDSGIGLLLATPTDTLKPPDMDKEEWKRKMEDNLREIENEDLDDIEDADDGPFTNVPGVTPDESSAALMGLTDLENRAPSFQKLMDDELLKRKKIGGLV